MLCQKMPRAALCLAGAWLLTGCHTVPSGSVMDHTAWQQLLQASPPAPVLLLGEQHDAPEHQQWQRDTAQVLIARNQLATVVLEMADQGYSTQGLPSTASEADVQQALKWNDKGWPWKAYGPTVMTAVHAGVPVVGGNLPRAQMKDVMQQPTWDAHLPSPAWERQRDAIRTGHCGLLPESQITPMARIQLAKDARMAQTIQTKLQPGKTVLLIAGRGHVLRSVGVPTWLPAEISRTIAIAQAGEGDPAEAQEGDAIVRTPAVPPKDYCATLSKG